MASPWSTPIVSPVLVGRDAEVALVRRCVDDIVAGTGATLLIAGEAGIGKSRLLAEARAAAAARGIPALVGYCFEPDQSLPYAPIRDLLRTFLAYASSEASAALDGIAPELVGLLPELQRQRPDVTPLPLGPEPDRSRLVQALIRFFSDLAAAQPLLIVLEDLHWADEASLDVLWRLARQIRAGCPILLLATYRHDEVGVALVTLLTALDRQRLVVEFRLAPLTQPDVGIMLHALSERTGPLPARMREAISDLAEGNPFFVEELLRTISADRDDQPARLGRGGLERSDLAIPRSIAEAVRLRVDRLRPETRDTARLAATCGRRFDFALLAAVSGCDEAELVRRVKELIAAQLVVEESADRFAFRHALTREAILTPLLARERRTRHRAVAEAIQRVYAANLEHHAADLALHWHAAEAWAEARDWAQRAGEQALALAVPRSAIDHLTRAIDACAQLGGPAPPAVYRSRGQAHETLGDFAAARADDEAALALARAAGDVAEEERALLTLGALWASHDYATAGEHFQAALTLARQTGDPVAMARSLNRLGNWRTNTGQPFAAIRHHDEALRLFTEIGDRHGIAESLDFLGIARYFLADVDGCMKASRQAIALLRQANERQLLVSTLTGLASIMGTTQGRSLVRVPRDVAASHDLLDEAIRIAREIGFLAGEAFALVCRADALGDRHPGRALAMALDAARIAEAIGHRQWRVAAQHTVGLQLIGVHDDVAARQWLEPALAAARAIGSTHWITQVSGDLATLRLRTSDLAGAAQLLDAALAPDAPMDTFNEREIWCSRVDLALAAGDPAAALAIVDRLIATTVGGAGTEGERFPHFALLRGMALAALGRADEAKRTLQLAHAAAAEAGILPVCWQAALALGKVVRASGEQDGADHAFGAARVAIDAFANEIDDAAQREAFLQQVTADLPPVRSPSARQVAKAAVGGLTERERAVAILVAQGLSNPQIADALYVSRETARTHVGHILSKLGLTSRAQIAAWATAHGLTKPALPEA